MSSTIEIRRIVDGDGEATPAARAEGPGADPPAGTGGARLRAHVFEQRGQPARPGWSLEWRWPRGVSPLAQASDPALRPPAQTRTSLAAYDA